MATFQISDPVGTIALADSQFTNLCQYVCELRTNLLRVVKKKTALPLFALVLLREDFLTSLDILQE